ncbi:MAG: HAD-IC family P-type ATPase [Armatimonadetes bacterium]|nr:HAD-IC family P-type ATPase [Armatimonadota bacterium]MDE2207807.1 HAD-IC family P-type ATPase [Armatimonadota bacterium]
MTQQPAAPSPLGLTSQEAADRLASDGPNSTAGSAAPPLLRFARRFWAPVPWMLEGAMVLQLLLHETAEAAVVGILLAFNAVLGAVQESRADATLRALRASLALNASVMRDGTWRIVPAATLVVGDLVKLSLGAVVPADVRLTDGSVLLDQSRLTGESLPVEASDGATAWAGALVRRGEASAEVTATGPRTRFGRAAELVRSAAAPSTEQQTVLRVVRNLAAFNGVVLALMVAYAFTRHMTASGLLPLALTGILASIPVALPATFTLAEAIGARALAARSVLPTRLSAVDEAASIDVLCTDKTGTLTRNQLQVADVVPLNGVDRARVLSAAALASAAGGQDPVDVAVRTAAGAAATANFSSLHFTPFDPATKLASCTAVDADGHSVRMVKGSVAAVVAIGGGNAPAEAGRLEETGYRVLAVGEAAGSEMTLLGLIALTDPPRDDAAQLIAQIHAQGIKTVMVTGDSAGTAAVVAHAVGLAGASAPAGAPAANVDPLNYAVYAGVLPEDKFALVQALQSRGHTVGMCGDGANDAPALRQAQMGIAVSTATDAARSAAGIVLTEPGLSGVVAAVRQGRTIFQRILTYTLNSLIKKIVQICFLAVGLLITGRAILTPMLMVLVLLTSDFLTMSLTTDNVRPSSAPNRWRIHSLMLAAFAIGGCAVLFCTGALLLAVRTLRLTGPTLQTYCLIVLVFTSEAVLYAIRDRRHIWSSAPGKWLVLTSVADVALISAMATGGMLMAPIPVALVASVLGASLLFALAADAVKAVVFPRLQLS